MYNSSMTLGAIAVALAADLANSVFGLEGWIAFVIAATALCIGGAAFARWARGERFWNR